MLDADNAAFINAIVTIIRWTAYAALACAILWIVFWIAYWLFAMARKATKWLWDSILSYESEEERARKKLKDLGY